MKRTLRLTATVLLGGCLFAGALALQYGNQIKVESRDGRYHSVRVNTGNDVRIVRRLSGAGCVLGRSWGYDSNRIWVDDGCRAIFEVGRDRYGRDDNWNRGRRDNDWNRGRRKDDNWNRGRYDDDRYWGGYQRLRLESTNGRRVTRRIENSGVNLLRQLSSTPCREGRTWGYNRDSIWVEDGCRAEFEVRVR